MLNTYSTTAQSVAINGTISFATNSISNCSCISHVAGSDTITLNTPGYYLVNFNATASATASATSPIIVQLLNGSSAIDGALTSALSAAADSPVALTFSTIVKVLPSCYAVDNTATLTFSNTGIAASFTNANVVITKVA